MNGQRRLSRRDVVCGAVAVGGLLGAQAVGVAPVHARNQDATLVASPATPGALPASPVARQFAWVLDQLNGGAAGLTEPEVRDRFSAEFVAAVAPAQLIAVLQELAGLGPATLEAYQELPGGTQAQALVAIASGDRLLVSIAVEPVAPYRIAGLLFEPYSPPGTPEALGSWGEFDQRWSALAPAVSFLAAEIVEGDCVPAHALDAEARLAIGSTFKLYVLGELARQIEDGRAAWDQALAIRDEWKSLPSGEFRQLPAGTERTLREYAEQMISVSDNTATDHLLFTLGRENVEDVQREMGHGEPAANEPFLATRELFAFKLALPAPAVAAYLAAPVEEQRQILATDVAAAEVDLSDAAEWTEPRLIESLEWFASAEDLCRAMAALHEWSQTPALAPVAEILALNPGLPFDTATWPYIGFKGGSEVGVLNLTWLLRREDGRLFALTGSLNNPEAPIDEPQAFLLMQSAAQLLGRSG